MKKREDMIRKFLLLLLSAAVVSAPAAPAQADWVQLAKLVASDGAAEDYFGVSVSISRDYAIVGAQQSWGASQPLDNGKAYIFKWDGAGWSQQQKLLASDGAAGDWFGQSVSISGDFAIVGANRDDDKGIDSGSAYIFKRDGTSWVQQQKLLASDGAADDYFGHSVSLSGDFAILGANGDDGNGNSSGSAYVFKWDGTSWVQQQKLLASDGAARDHLGASVSISGDLAIVGAPGDNDKGKWTGSAYIFKRDGTSWVQQQKLLASDGAAIDFFGHSVSISGDLAIVGAGEGGSAYIFKWDGTSWVQQQKLLASDSAAGDGFGVSVSISGDLAIVGAHYDDDNGEWTGSAYIFKWDGTSWVEQQKLLASDGAAGDRFGVSVSLSGDLAVVGAYWDDDACPEDVACDSGSAYLLNLPGLISRACAYGPRPFDGALHADTWVNLEWRAGDSAVSHDVYLGDDFEDVNTGTGDTFRGNLLSMDYVVGLTGFPYPDGLVRGSTYYWRIDEVNDTEPNSPWKGPVWSFTIPPKIAYNPDPSDGAEFVDLNVELNWTAGLGAPSHAVYFGDNLDDLGNATASALQTATTYTPGPLEFATTYYWRVDEFGVGRGGETHKGDVWAFTTPGAVGNPQPANGDEDAHILTTLAWTPAENAASSDLYFGTDADAVKNATTASPEYAGNMALGSESHDPGKLALAASYHWRVDAVYPDKTVKGLLWSFATADFILVDDFESYDDADGPLEGDAPLNRIFDKWIDGFGTATNGALVGNDFPPYAETTIVHGGAQSMIYRYDNAGKTSEATLTLVWPRDWTEEGVTKLSLWHNGSASNAADRIYVALNGTAVIYHDDPAATQIEGWTGWVIDLAAFGVNLTNVNTITIGIGTRNAPVPGGGSGTLYFDDIRLIRYI